MRALVYEGNHTLNIKEVPVPTVEADEVLIRVKYCGICGTDMLIWHDGMARVNPPVVLGHEFSGVITQVGEAVTDYKPGDRVVVEPLLTCGVCRACKMGAYNVCLRFRLIGIDADGGMTAYVKAPARKLFKIPDNISDQAAAFVEPLAVGVHMVRQSGLQSGQTVLITGGGPIGLVAASVAKEMGARVYISEINPFRIKMAQDLGFNVINPQQENVVDRIRQETGGDGADASLEATGTSFGLADCIQGTAVKGVVVLAGLPKKVPSIDVYQIVAKELAIHGSRVYRSEDYEKALRLMADGRFDPTPFISRIVTLDNVVADGFESIDRGDPVVKILVDLSNEENS